LRVTNLTIKVILSEKTAAEEKPDGFLRQPVGLGNLPAGRQVGGGLISAETML
jgi:hypothetical protein